MLYPPNSTKWNKWINEWIHLFHFLSSSLNYTSARKQWVPRLVRVYLSFTSISPAVCRAQLCCLGMEDCCWDAPTNLFSPFLLPQRRHPILYSPDHLQAGRKKDESRFFKSINNNDMKGCEKRQLVASAIWGKWGKGKNCVSKIRWRPDRSECPFLSQLREQAYGGFVILN